MSSWLSRVDGGVFVASLEDTKTKLNRGQLDPHLGRAQRALVFLYSRQTHARDRWAPRVPPRGLRRRQRPHTPVLRHRPARTRLEAEVRSHKLSINNKLEQPHARHRPVIDALRSHATLAEHPKKTPIDGLVSARVDGVLVG